MFVIAFCLEFDMHGTLTIDIQSYICQHDLNYSQGQGSSDEEDLQDVPDDQYDTEDSFIDDAELVGIFICYVHLFHFYAGNYAAVACSTLTPRRSFSI